MLAIEVEKEVVGLLDEGKTIASISMLTGVNTSTVSYIKNNVTLRRLKRKKEVLSKMKPRLSSTVKCASCGSRIYEWPCLYCNPSSRLLTSGPMKQADEETVIDDGIQIAGPVTMPSAERVILLVRLARNIIEMRKNGLSSETLLKHLEADARAALIVTENRTGD